MDSDFENEVCNILDVSADLFDDSDHMETTSLRQITKSESEFSESAHIEKRDFITTSQDDIPGSSNQWSENSNQEESMYYAEQSSLDDSIKGVPNKRHKIDATENAHSSSTCDNPKIIESENSHNLKFSPEKNDFGFNDSKIAFTVSSPLALEVISEQLSDDVEIVSKPAETHLSQINLKNEDGVMMGSLHKKEEDIYSVSRYLKLPENKNSCNEKEPNDASPKTGAVGLYFTCPFCSLSETDIHSLEEHIEVMHPVNMSGELGGTGTAHNANSDEARAMSTVEEAVFLYVCPLCDLDLGDETTLHLHLNIMHEEEPPIRGSSTINCPLCEVGCLSEQEMKYHMKTHSSDDTKYCVSTNEMAMDNGTYFMMCPVCKLAMDDADLLTSHVESHFNPQHSAGPSSSSHTDINDLKKHFIGNSIKGLQNSEISVSSTSVDTATKSNGKQFKSHSTNVGPSKCIDLNKKTVWSSESKERVTTGASEGRVEKTSGNLPPSNSRENGGYKKQYEQNLERAVVKGELSVAEFHDEMRKLSHQIIKGVDDGSTRIQGLIEKMEAMYRSQARPGQSVLLCSATDHFSGSIGDKGWGCGYRNFQMILSCLAKLNNYAERIFPDEQRLIPSIPKIQQMIESAWQQGFDPQGCIQLNGKLCNTRKWIGATEIVAVLSSLGIKCQLVDFHSPSAPDGTHPRLLEWVKEYFKRFHYQPTAPLYLQHQGHSRTIVGVENDKGTVKLLLFDPGTPKDQIAAQMKGQMSWKDMRLFRRAQANFKARQYQIVTIVGTLTDQEYQESKILKSERIY
ncbi:unnamed protein product [Lymnaea stagnalis]|uniref:Zinc finger-containing ubiquitin peptidase 1 n=1 Tax=Lymnaea stagnalis TaxID=6523 RepID=A0AAV2IGL3_LYMST